MHLAEAQQRADTDELSDLPNRDPSTHAHSRTVGRFAAQIAARLGLSGERVEEVRVAGLLHDIGEGRGARLDPPQAGPVFDFGRGMDPAAAQAEPARGWGTQFDGAVVDAFLSALREGSD